MEENPEIARARRYYDAFAATYEDRRDGRSRYHDHLDAMEVDLATPYVRGREVLEVGCGTGLILRRIAPIARRAAGVDPSPEMRARAIARGLEVHDGHAAAIPLPDRSFDVALAFKTVPHVPDLRAAFAEMARVVRPGGVMIVEVYNPTSVRGWLKRILPPAGIGAGMTEHDVGLRYDARDDVERALPRGLRIERVRGVQTVVPAAFALELPALGRALVALDRSLADTRLAARFGGFVSYVLRRV